MWMLARWLVIRTTPDWRCIRRTWRISASRMAAMSPPSPSLLSALTSVHVDRLGDRVDRAGLLDELASDLVALGAHQHDRQRPVRRVRAELAAELVAVHPRHHEIEQDDVVLRPFLDELDALGAVLRDGG